MNRRWGRITLSIKTKKKGWRWEKDYPGRAKVPYKLPDAAQGQNFYEEAKVYKHRRAPPTERSKGRGKSRSWEILNWIHGQDLILKGTNSSRTTKPAKGGGRGKKKGEREAPGTSG